MRKKFVEWFQSEDKLSLALGLSLLFSLGLPQFPLFSSNQNTYLLEGIASVVGEPLASDWLANQTSNIPVFSWLISVSYTISPNIFYIYHVLLGVILIYSLYLISAQLQPRLLQKVPTVIFFCLMYLLSISLTYMLGVRYPTLSGIAGQYILGPVFQPSAFGVFLLASVAFFFFKRYYVAIICCIIAAYFHPTYILQAGFLVFTYQFILLLKHKHRISLFLGLLALLLLLPLVFYIYYTFVQVPFEISDVAQRILVFDRLSHHALPSHFNSSMTVFGLLTIGAAIFIGRNNFVFFQIIFIPVSLSFLFVLTATVIDNNFMLLLFGQRSSVWLVPLSSAFIVARISSEIKWSELIKIDSRYLFITGIIFMVLISSLGVYKTISDHVKHKSQKIYTFLSMLNYEDGVLLIPVGRLDIRLNAKVPVFVDRKSHPYKAEEVIEWNDRVNLAKEFYKGKSNEEKLSALNRIRARDNIRFILSDIDNPIRTCVPIYEDRLSLVYDVHRCYRK